MFMAKCPGVNLFTMNVQPSTSNIWSHKYVWSLEEKWASNASVTVQGYGILLLINRTVLLSFILTVELHELSGIRAMLFQYIMFTLPYKHSFISRRI